MLFPGNQHAADELDKALIMIRRRDEQPSEMERLKEQAQKDALAPPKLSAKSNIPIQVQFRDRPVGQIFDVIGKASQINFIYDEKTDLNKPMTIEIGSVTLERALDVLMLQTKNFYKIIDEHTLLIAPDNRQKRQELEDQVIRTFYLVERRHEAGRFGHPHAAEFAAGGGKRPVELDLHQGHARQGRDRGEADRLQRQVEGEVIIDVAASGDQPQDPADRWGSTSRRSR